MAEGGDSRPPSTDPLDVEGGTANLESTKGSGRPLLRSISAFTQRQFSRPVTQRQYSTASTTVSRPPTAPTSRSFQFRFPKTPRSRKHSTYSSVSNTSRYNTRMSFQFGYPKTPRSRKYSTYSTVSNASRKFAEGTKSFFGIGEDCTHTQKRWSQRRVRHASRRYGKIKEESIQRILEPDPAAIPLPQIVDPLALPHRQRMVPAPYDDIDGATDYTTPTTPGAWSSASSLWRRAAFGALTQQRQKVQRQQSVVSMGWDLLVKMTLQQKREQDVAKPAPLVNSRSFAPVSMEEDDDIDDLDFSFFGRDEDMYDDEVFFDASPTPQGTLQYDAVQPGRAGMAANVFDMVDGGAAPAEYEIRAGDALDREEREANARMLPTDRGWRTGSKKRIAPPLRGQDVMAARAPRRRNRIGDRVLQMALDNSDRREYGRGLVGKWLKRSYRSSMAMSSDIKHQLDTITDYRPYFTYWVTFVHILITIIALAVYGIAPIGFAETETTALVRTPKLSLENIPKIEKDNFWIGPKDEDLIHLGAKYSPCMRKDPKIIQRIEDQRRKENQTGCCIKTDQSGCYQSVEDDCSKTFAEFWRWSEDNPDPAGSGRISGAVCGQDPKACKNPASVAPHEWPDDMTKWPVCKEPVASSSGLSRPHMDCEVTAHPCCIGITGTCEITTREYCEFKHGFFHQEASLCSQVSCMDRICGLLPFMDPEVPDQFYRLWTSLFLHAGLVHLLLSVIFQMTILRDLEKLAGWGRIAIIYILSGIGGNLASAVFLPYQAEVGPAGAHFGVIACLFVEVFQSWQMLQAPWRAILKLSIIVLVLFLLGLLPWIDNFAHITGFICGILLSFSFLPYITFGAFDKNRKRIQIIVSFLLFVAFFSGLVVLFYVRPLTDCQGCEYVNCIPFDKTFCKYQGLDLTPRDETT
ncbi:inactive rhomboid protein 1-like isoform X3 [Branchiostoma floridae x Branchiostoma japonicum]